MKVVELRGKKPEKHERNFMKKSNKSCNLESCFMCRLALKEWKQTIDCHRKNFLVKKGETLIKEGDPAEGVYFVYSGKIKVHKTWGDRELILRFASDGAILGHRGINSKNNIYPVSATAIEPTMVCFIDMEFFMATLRVNHDFTFRLMMFYADELRESERRMRNLALMPVKGRLARALLQLQEQFGVTENGSINIELSRQDLAAFAGATYETVFRTMNELIQDKLISVTGKQIYILEPEKLLSYTQNSDV